MPRRRTAKIRLKRRVRLNRGRAEALQIEVRRLAKRLGLSIAELQVRRLEEKPSPRRPAPRSRSRPK
jgi:hypothetical protein